MPGACGGLDPSRRPAVTPGRAGSAEKRRMPHHGNGYRERFGGETEVAIFSTISTSANRTFRFAGMVAKADASRYARRSPNSPRGRERFITFVGAPKEGGEGNFENP